MLAAAFVILFGFPGRTRQVWAWTIAPDMTAAAMGGGYLAGAWFFARVATTRTWHAVGHGVLATSVFATVLLVATLVHWDRFNHDHVSFWAWLALYLITPVLLPTLWWRNRRLDPRAPGPAEALLPTWLRAGMVVVGLAQGLTALQLALWPGRASTWWPWALTPLTARTLSAFLAFPAVMFTCAAVDRRWSSFRIPFEVMAVGVATYALATLGHADSFRDPTVRATFLAALVLAFATLVAVRLAMDRPASAPGRSTPALPAG